jgi:hypothetical protein
MTTTVPQDPTDARSRVLDGLARLRAAFPLEQRLLESKPAVRIAYAQLLSHWRLAVCPPDDAIDDALLTELIQLDAVVPQEHGLGCYPFSSNDTGIRVTLPAGTVYAMCAIDALAMARLTRTRTRIESTCTTCGAAIACHVEENGGLDHDQVDLARVLWQSTAGTATSCSRGLCRQLRFLCPACRVPHASDCFTLPQATAIGNAFFRFQTAVLATQPDRVT